jgi:hypothetical protein
LRFSKRENRHLKKPKSNREKLKKKRNCLVIQESSFFKKELSEIEISINNFLKFDYGLFVLSRTNYLKNIELQ